MRTFKNDPETKIGAWLLDNMIKKQDDVYGCS